MKRLLCVFLCLTLACACAAASASPYDALFDAGEAKASPVSLSLPAGTAVSFPPYYADYNGLSYEIPGQIVLEEDTEVSILSLSPTGDSALLKSEDALLVMCDGTVSAVCPDPFRGAEDSNACMRDYYQGYLLNGRLGEEGVVWSPDGRYAVMPNANQVLKYMRLIVEPILLDARTGELILLETTGTKRIGGGSGAMLSACFSEDGKTLYYTYFYGGLSDIRLKAYDLESGTLSELCKVDASVYYPLLTMRNGMLFCISDTVKAQEKQGLGRFYQENGAWRFYEQKWLLPSGFCRLTRLQAAPGGGPLLLTGVIGTNQKVTSFMFCLADPDQGLMDMYQLYTLNRTDGSVTSLAAEELISQRREPLEALSSGAILCLSPDGSCMLAVWLSVAEGQWETRSELIRLSDFKAIPVTFEGDGAPDQTIFWDGYPAVEWTTGDTILIYNGNNSTVFQLQY